MNSQELFDLCDSLATARTSVEAGTSDPLAITDLVTACMGEIQSKGPPSDVSHILQQLHARMLFVARANRVEEAGV